MSQPSRVSVMLNEQDWEIVTDLLYCTCYESGGQWVRWYNRIAQEIYLSLGVNAEPRFWVDDEGMWEHILRNGPPSQGYSDSLEVEPECDLGALDQLWQDFIQTKQQRFSQLPDLDEDQCAAVTHRGSNLLIIAGAGSGKTRTLTHRAVSLLSEIEPENLMVVTFTKKAAQEISTRIEKNVPADMKRALKRAWIGTFHSICWRILMENGHLVGLSDKWGVLDMPDSERVMRLSTPSRLDAKEVYRLYSFARNSMTDWRDWVNTQRFPDLKSTEQIGRAIGNYNRRCRRNHRVDFDDLQVLTYKLLKENSRVRETYQHRLKAILVDEYQDTNRIQASILKFLAGRTNVTVVGDDAQSIYGFRAATVENIINFEQEFNATRITIGTNYRSTPEVVDLSSHSIEHNSRQIPKKLRAAKPSGSLPKLFRGEFPEEEAAWPSYCRRFASISKTVRHSIKWLCCFGLRVFQRN